MPDLNDINFERFFRQKSLVVGQYTSEPPPKCVVLDGDGVDDEGKPVPEINTVEELFNYYQPEITVGFDAETKENFQFLDIGDFLPEGENGFINKSPVLSSNKAQVETLEELASNIVDSDYDALYKALNDVNARAAILEGLDLISSALKENKI